MTGMLPWAAVAAGAAVGAPARYLLDQLISRRVAAVFPYGTLAVNVLGSFLVGLLAGLLLRGGSPGPAAALAWAGLGTGFCGAFTTFSTFGFESVRLAEDGSYAEAGLNVLVSAAAGLLAVAAGWLVASLAG